MNRRGFLLGAGALLAAPAIVRVSSLMAIKPLPQLQEFVVFADSSTTYTGYKVLADGRFQPILHMAKFWQPTDGLRVGERFTLEGVYRT